MHAQTNSIGYLLPVLNAVFIYIYKYRFKLGLENSIKIHFRLKSTKFKYPQICMNKIRQTKIYINTMDLIHKKKYWSIILPPFNSKSKTCAKFLPHRSDQTWLSSAKGISEFIWHRCTEGNKIYISFSNSISGHRSG